MVNFLTCILLIFKCILKFENFCQKQTNAGKVVVTIINQYLPSTVKNHAKA